MTKHGFLRTLIAVELACGLSAVAACEDQLGYPAEKTGLDLPSNELPLAASSAVLWGVSLTKDVPEHERINLLGGA